MQGMCLISCNLLLLTFFFRDMMFVFCCDFLHTICLTCFSGYCQMQMNNKKFEIFDNIGYSVCCPGNNNYYSNRLFNCYTLSAATCTSSPVRDPHHFYLVNEKKKFVCC